MASDGFEPRRLPNRSHMVSRLLHTAIPGLVVAYSWCVGCRLLALGATLAGSRGPISLAQIWLTFYLTVSHSVCVFTQTLHLTGPVRPAVDTLSVCYSVYPSAAYFAWELFKQGEDDVSSLYLVSLLKLPL